MTSHTLCCWQWLTTWQQKYSNHLTCNLNAPPIYRTHYKIVCVGLQEHEIFWGIPTSPTLRWHKNTSWKEANGRKTSCISSTRHASSSAPSRSASHLVFPTSLIFRNIVDKRLNCFRFFRQKYSGVSNVVFKTLRITNETSSMLDDHTLKGAITFMVIIFLIIPVFIKTWMTRLCYTAMDFRTRMSRISRISVPRRDKNVAQR